MDKFHPFAHGVDASALPQRFNNPFSYRPHALCVQAADEVRRVVNANGAWRDEVAGGKMFGVLVVRNAAGECGYLAAFSGLLGGCNEHGYFVPAVFDFISPDGYFKKEEGEISNINRLIKSIKEGSDYTAAALSLASVTKERDDSLAAMREAMRLGKELRDKRRAAGGLTVDEDEALLNESRFAKAEYRRCTKAWEVKVAECNSLVAPFEQQMSALRDERKRRSAALQQWLFDNFVFLNIKGEHRSLSAIFADTAQRVPPAGAGECAAPKLLQYAFRNGLTPVAMAEFWMGASPVGEVRRDGCFYGSCTSKCRPILGFMLQGMDVEPSPLEGAVHTAAVEIIYEDDYLLAVNKPAGMLSVPGIVGGLSVEEHLQALYGDRADIRVVHRLDMATSGVLLAAKSVEVFTALQGEFAGRRVQKRYVALLDGVPAESSGVVALPLSADYENRPRQIVDKVSGKQAITEYSVLGVEEYEGRRCARVYFYPLTGRTHQLRLHSAYSEGLDTPIVGDELYGTVDKRLMLHAEYVSFTHPVTGERVEVSHSPDF